MPYKGEQRGELFIHWFYRDRKSDRLSRCEIFHLNMLQYFNVLDRVKVIHIRCASPNLSPTAAMLHAIEILSAGKAVVDFKCVLPKPSWEHDTIKEAAEYAAETGEFVYYTHFKGVSRVTDSLFGSSRGGCGDLDIFYWSWLLYSILFGAPSYAKAIGPLYRCGVNKSYEQGRSRYGIAWSALRGRPPHHYAGSFQGFDGSFLKKKFKQLGLEHHADRESKLWVQDAFTVEMFLSLVFDCSEVYSGAVFGRLDSYNLYHNHILPRRLAQFKRWPSSKAENTAVFIKPIKCKYAVVTYLYGEHSILREPVVRDSDVTYVCVTDNLALKASPASAWKVVFDPWQGFSGRFKHMQAKFRPFRYVDAERVLVIDSSIRVTDSLHDVFASPIGSVALKPHPLSKSIGEELPKWVKVRGMSRVMAKDFADALSSVRSSLGAPVYELDASLWSNTESARLFGEAILAFAEGVGRSEPFLSNQLCASALATSCFALCVDSLRCDLPLEKYVHGTWKFAHSLSARAQFRVNAVRAQFLQKMGYALDLCHPKTFCEKLAWLKVYDSIPLKTRCADKIAVREYVKEKTGEDLGIPLLGTYDKFSDIDFKALPQSYVLKCNHGSGMNIIVAGGNLDKEAAHKKIDAWMHTDYLHLLEFHYKPIPKKIFVEPYLTNGLDGLIDYKFWCFNGRPVFYGVNAGHGHGAITYYDLSGALFSIQRADYKKEFVRKWERPATFDQMVEYAKKLSADFKFVRVDFYAVDGHVYFGELTFIPGGGYIKFRGNGDEELGKILNLQ